MTLGWSGGAIVLGKLPVPGHPTNFDYSRTREYCSRCGWGLFGHFYSRLSFLLSFSGRRPSAIFESEGELAGLCAMKRHLDLDLISTLVLKPATPSFKVGSTIRLAT